MRSSWFLMSFVILALIGCVQGMPPQGQAPYTQFAREQREYARAAAGMVAAAVACSRQKGAVHSVLRMGMNGSVWGEWPVGTRVGNVTRNDLRLIEPVATG
jgi:hypothetical protein